MTPTRPVQTLSTPVGTFARIPVRGCSRSRAIRLARYIASHELGLRVVDVASAVDQGADLGWIVEVRVVPRKAAA